MVSWVPGADASGFGLDNLPYGVFCAGTADPRCCVRIGDHVLDVSRVDTPYATELAASTLNDFLALGRDAWRTHRARVAQLLSDPAHRAAVSPYLLPLTEVTLHLPIAVADYVDFYASREHASNLGAILRPGTEPLTPNWRHLPIGYHGRAGTVVVSGTPVVRPGGQRAAGDFGPTRRLDIEAELGFVVGTPSKLGTRVSTAAFRDHVFGVVLVNDWSARDIQAFEYVPLGPFLGKSFATSISPWVVPLAALESAWVDPPPREPEPLPYLAEAESSGVDIELEVEWNGVVVSRPPCAGLYWTGPQQLAHQTVNGASLRTGDLYASGTVSGPDRSQRGSFIELSWNGQEPVAFPDGSQRSFLADGDTVTIRGSAPGPAGVRIALGEVTGTVEPFRGS
jgi:fumarylacetoacetase